MWFVFAVAAASCFGLRGILYHWTSQRPIDRNLLLLGVYLSGTLITVTGNLFIQQSWSTGALFGILMGLFSFIANASMYKGYAVGKASIVALFTGLPPLVVMIVAFVLWREELTAWQFTAFFIVLSGLILIKYSQDLKLNQLKGIQWGVLTMLFFGFTDVSVKQATLSGAATLPILTVMFLTGSVLFGISWAVNKSKGTASSNEEDSPNKWTMKRTLGWGMIVGITNAAGMLLIFPAFRDGITGIVSAIVAMNVAFVILYARFYLKEDWNKREITGLSMAFVGILILRIAS
ncbi:EamA family transporter [Neobacillus novalis]|uniref:EamA family transporter n=1 Tax=Neobacillus novalis TaxID=220687 RepID=A0AA95MLD0_9BACI|nr:EamA family transporter [Neobacillus novalis]WHY85640.1 EamA family transporter [Neobacillus novalis]